jgi:hypothetical protein
MFLQTGVGAVSNQGTQRTLDLNSHVTELMGARSAENSEANGELHGEAQTALANTAATSVSFAMPYRTALCRAVRTLQRESS